MEFKKMKTATLCTAETNLYLQQMKNQVLFLGI